MAHERLGVCLERIQAIGVEITSLMEESKSLREEVAEAMFKGGLGQVTEEKPIKFFKNGAVVSVIKAKGAKDYTVTFEYLPEL
jgi:hypothetical protein